MVSKWSKHRIKASLYSVRYSVPYRTQTSKSSALGYARGLKLWPNNSEPKRESGANDMMGKGMGKGGCSGYGRCGGSGGYDQFTSTYLPVRRTCFEVNLLHSRTVSI